MTWIKTIGRGEATGELKELYEKLRDRYPKEYGISVPAVTREDGTQDSIVESHSLLPKVMYHMFAGLAELFTTEHGLTRRQQEMVNTLVSSINSCHY